ncbi:type II toxin-antitoxin system VapC family toxin [Chelatococcus sambhunathii]|uniref:Ribonuclease VapC n=1 Tax=Chelatococcus sambhunathii TaxID=363953 RepID=A0ABU1DKB3_9HYPH|nr:type II toxin-antitoxin system VapC family toxin [Chelatococcus sambhunathii]MDR4308511.1 type II toxin-antitoxin system VapC family toxin [Chelatococcus sambhunathii]
MPFVTDASITASWLLPDESDPRAVAAYDLLDEQDAAAPSLWWFEARNILVVNERRGRIDAGTVDQAVAVLARLPIRIDQEPDDKAVLRLARRHRLTVYDAAYLELAVRLGSPLATLDDALARAAAGEGVPLIGE